MNFKLLLSITFIATLVACGGAEERKAAYMEKAKTSIKAGDLDKARIELKNVLQIDPKYSEAYYQIGIVHERLKDYPKAFANYKKAEEFNPDHLENQVRLGRFYLHLIKDSEKAQEKIDFVLSKEPDNTEGLLLKAGMLLNKKKEAEAISIANAIVVKEPGHADSVIFLATIYLSKNQISEAISILDGSLKSNENDVQLNKLLALAYTKNKDYPLAEKIYLKLLEINPDNLSNRRVLAAFYNSTGDKEKAEQTLRASIDNKPSDVDRVFDLIKYISVERGNKEAIDELKLFISKNKGLGKLRIALGEFLYINNKKEEAIAVYEKAVEDFGEEETGIEARIVLASIYIKNNEYIKADSIIEEAILISSNNPKVNFIRSKIALKNNNIEKAIISLRIVIREAPENIDAYILLAKSFQLDGKKEEIKDTLNNAYNNNKSNPDALLKLAKFYLSSDNNLALKIINDYSDIKGPDYDGLSIKASMLNKTNKINEAYALSEKLIEMYPDMPNGYLQAMPYYGQQKDVEKAILVLEEGYLKVKDNRKILILLSTFQASKKQFDVVEKRIKEELKASPNDAELKIFLSKVYATKKESKAAEVLLKEVVAENPEIEEPYLILSLIYINRKDHDSVISILNKGVSNVVASTKIPFRLANIYESKNEYKKAIEIYRTMHKNKPKDLVVINNLASLLSDYGDDDDLQFAKTIAIKLESSNESVFLDTLGWVYYKLGDYDKAVALISQVVKVSPEVNDFNFHLGMAYKMSGDKVQAKVYLEKSLANDKQFKGRELAKAALKDL